MRGIANPSRKVSTTALPSTWTGAPSSSFFHYLADQTVDDRFELYAVDIEGKQAPAVLNGPLSRTVAAHGTSLPCLCPGPQSSRPEQSMRAAAARV